MIATYLILIIILLILLTPFGIDYVSNNNAEWNVVAGWTPNGRPGINDQVTCTHKKTITDTEEYIRRFFINNGGEIEINAVAANSGLKVGDATLARMFVQAGGILDMNGDKSNEYLAYIQCNDSAPSNDVNTEFFGTVSMNYAEISGFWYGTTIGSVVYPWIDCTGIDLDMTDSLIGGHKAHGWYWHGLPDVDNQATMLRSEFLNLWPSLYYDASNYFYFDEYFRNVYESNEPIGVKHGIIGRSQGRSHQLGMMGREWEIETGFHALANRWKAQELELQAKKNYKWALFMPETIAQAVYIGPIEHHRPTGNLYAHDLSVEFIECDPD